MPNYKLGKIYKIVNSVDDKVYVGHTTERLLCNRMTGHRARARQNNLKYKLFEHMRKIGVKHFRIVLVEHFPCTCKDDLTAREEFWRKKLNATLIANVCHRSTEYKKQYDQQFRDTHKAERKAYMAKYNKVQVECLCGTVCNRSSKGRHRNSDKHQKWLTKNPELAETCFTVIDPL